MRVMVGHSPSESAMSVVTRALFTGLLLTSLSAAAVDVPALESAVDSPARADAQRARDPYRHPLQTLEFFAIAPEIGRAHSELQSLMRISYAVFCLKKQTSTPTQHPTHNHKQQDHNPIRNTQLI